jgi:chemotaxis protein methyltransferase CheR
MVAPTALFLGSAEAIWPVTDRFEAVRIGNTFVHRPRPPATAERARSAPVAKDSGAGPPAAGTTAARRGAGHRHPVGRKRKDRAPASPPAPVSVVSPVSPVVDADADVTTQLASTGQQALTTGDSRSAVVSFRKWAYLAPADALAQLHLGLALEADGDLPAARRAYAVARRLLLAADPAHVERATEGYATGELLRLLDHKEQGLKP